MDLPSLFAFVIWLLLFLIAVIASAAHAVAASVSELQFSLLALWRGRVHQLNVAGAILGMVAVATAAGVAVTATLDQGGGIGAAATAAALSSLILLTAQALARQVARRQPDRLARFLLGDAAVFLPLIEPRTEEKGGEEVLEQTLEQMVDASEKAGLIESGEHDMISGIIRLDRTLVREIMVPRIDMIAVSAEASLQDALDVVIEGAHSRVPIYEDSIDHIIGLLYAKDLLRILRDDKREVPLRSLLRPAHFVPESKRLDELLQELQSTKVHMAIVVDEYGGTAGLVTIEDVLEEIVGEIQDEYDLGEEPLVERVNDQESIFDARVKPEEVNQILKVDLPDESDTLGGLVYQRLGKIPKVGDRVEVDGATVAVLSVVGRRIKKVRVTRKTPLENEGGRVVNEEQAHPG